MIGSTPTTSCRVRRVPRLALRRRPRAGRRDARRRDASPRAAGSPETPRRVSGRGFRIAVLASGTGTNLQAILDSLHGRAPSRSPGSGPTRRTPTPWSGVARRGSRRRHSRRRASTTRGSRPRDRRLARFARRRAGRPRRLHAIALAGVVIRFANRIVNVHPALLPSFPGLDAVGQALDHGVRITGVTVHFVDEGVDSGPIILQRPSRCPASRDRAALEAAIHATEHVLCPRRSS